jgi:predicted glycosyltransferase
VLVCAPIVETLREEGWNVVLTARRHSQTLELARIRWPEVEAIGGPSPGNRLAKAAAIAQRAQQLARFARSRRPAVALSHGSYAQIVAARMLRIPAVTMMDYEHQPANHLSFRLAHRVIVPSVFPSTALHKYGVGSDKVSRYDGFKEQLYLAGFIPNPRVLDELRISGDDVTVVFRTPPDGALYHHGLRGTFDDVLDAAASTPGVSAILLPRDGGQAQRYSGRDNIVIPALPLDTLSLLACADLVIGAGGTMTREAALLGTPTYTVFAGALGAVDAELIRLGKLHDLRHASESRFEKRHSGYTPVPTERAESILRVILEAVDHVSAG